MACNGDDKASAHKPSEQPGKVGDNVEHTAARAWAHPMSPRRRRMKGDLTMATAQVVKLQSANVRRHTTDDGQSS